MLEIIVLVFSITVLSMVAGKYLFPHELQFREIGVIAAVAIVVTAAIIGGGMYANQADTQILNGKVVNKSRNEVSCSHSYNCHCHTTCSTTNGHRSCSEHCSTCYEHRFDVDWDVNTTVGTINIDRVDRRGLDEPKRWSIVQINEPVSRTSTYTNYIRAAPESLFGHVFSERTQYVIPTYPTVHDYYRINRVVQVGTTITNPAELNQMLNDRLRDLGPSKQVNVIPVFTKYDYNYSRVLEAKWLGGKKNDVVVVTGLARDSNTIEWVYVFSWSKNSMVNVALRDNIKRLDKLDNLRYSSAVADAISKHYIRRPMKEFEYLQYEYDPPVWLVWLAALFNFIGSIAAAWYFSRPHVNF